jgi:dolichol-phosphate mannosyltransferase
VGWASVMTIILFVSGIMLIMIGIVGIYIGRIFQEVKNRPKYILEEVING